MVVEGKAEAVYVSDKTFGKYNSYRQTVKVDGAQYSMFTKSNEGVAQQGDMVEFTAEQNDKGYWNINPKTFKVTQKAQQSGGGNSYPQSNSDFKQESIVRQSTLGYASTIMSSLISSGRYSDLTDEEIFEQTVYLVDSLFYPYCMNGEKSSSNKGGVSEFQGSDGDEPDDDLPF